MEKKLYIQPVTEVVTAKSENLMISASPGVGDKDYDTNSPIDSKAGDFFDSEGSDELPHYNLWDE